MSDAEKSTKSEKPAEPQKKPSKKEPAGGHDDTPLPTRTGGYTVKFTFHKATNLPMSDLSTLSSDPFLLCELLTPSLPQRHKADGPLKLRTPTCHKTTEPEWNIEWVVANVPSSGFKLKVRVMDEDPDNHDDRLGNVHVYYDHIDEHFSKVDKQPFSIMKRSGSWRAYGVRACVSGLSKKKMNGDLYVSVQVLGKTEGPGGKVFTLGPNTWSCHFSPLIGKIAGTKQKNQDGVERSNFEACQIQFSGRVPDELYHRYVEFKPFVKGMFTRLGLRGRILHGLLMHQHARIYLYDKQTKYGVVEKPSEELALQFLRMAHFDQGSRTFTYVMLLDGMFRFTMTGKEFSIDLLSKHTMHSEVAQYIACSGEFIIRRAKNRQERDRTPVEEQDTHPPNDNLNGGPPEEKPSEDVQLYELLIDNDSGTYRPNADLLPKLREFLEQNLVGLKVITKNCADDKWQEMKKQQRERRKKEGGGSFYAQGNISSGSLSSSDEEDLADREHHANAEEGATHDARERIHSATDALKDPKAQAFKWAEKA